MKRRINEKYKHETTKTIQRNNERLSVSLGNGRNNRVYDIYFEEKGVKDIISFVKWCVLNDEEKSRISATIAHDLNGMRSECFLPRTSGYTKALKKEIK